MKSKNERKCKNEPEKLKKRKRRDQRVSYLILSFID